MFHINDLGKGEKDQATRRQKTKIILRRGMEPKGHDNEAGEKNFYNHGVLRGNKGISKRRGRGESRRQRRKEDRTDINGCPRRLFLGKELDLGRKLASARAPEIAQEV